MGRPANLGDRLWDCGRFFARTVSKCAQRGVQRGGTDVAHGLHQPRSVLGVRLTMQTVVLIISVLVIAALIGLAVLTWLERQA